MVKLPGYYTLDEAAIVLARSNSQVARYVRSGRLKAVDLGGQKLLPQQAVHDFTPPPRGNPNFFRKKC
jgi:excisionase family DNA binding protein